jgi:hypothetical protein
MIAIGLLFIRMLCDFFKPLVNVGNPIGVLESTRTDQAIPVADSCRRDMLECESKS